MSRDAERARRYLAAMGIEVWQMRRPRSVSQTGQSTKPAPLPAEDDHAVAPEAAAAAVGDEAPIYAESAPPLVATAADDEAADPITPPGDERVVRIARMDWEDLQTTVRACTACELHAGRTQTVFGVGNRQAHWMIIGEAPGADEDRLGEPFVGRAGKLLDLMLLALGLQREQVFIANILKCRPPQNRDPTPTEAGCCWPFLERQIALVRPRIIVAVGRIAAQNLLRTEVPVSKLRGRVHRLPPNDIPVVVSYHPAYLLRSPREKRKAWDDLQMARRVLNTEPAR